MPICNDLNKQGCSHEANRCKIDKSKNPYVQFCSMQSIPLVFQFELVYNPNAAINEVGVNAVCFKCQGCFPTTCILLKMYNLPAYT